MVAPQVMSGDRALALGLAPVEEPAAVDAEAIVAAAPAGAERAASTAAPGLAFFEECPDAILRFDAGQRVVYANPAVERATAVSRWQFVGHRLEEVEHFSEFAPLWNETLAAVLDSSGLPAGDFVRWVRQVIDLAGQIAQAPGTEALAPKCRQLVTMMRRDIADFAVDED